MTDHPGEGQAGPGAEARRAANCRLRCVTDHSEGEDRHFYAEMPHPSEAALRASEAALAEADRRAAKAQADAVAARMQTEAADERAVSAELRLAERTKERDRAIQERDHYCNRLGNEEQDHGNTRAALVIAQSREVAARAEATKAVAAVEAEICDDGYHSDAHDGCHAALRILAAIRAPRQPEPVCCRSCGHLMEDNAHGLDQSDGYVCDEHGEGGLHLVHAGHCIYCKVCQVAWNSALLAAQPAPSSPPPPSEEPR